MKKLALAITIIVNISMTSCSCSPSMNDRQTMACEDTTAVVEECPVDTTGACDSTAVPCEEASPDSITGD